MAMAMRTAPASTPAICSPRALTPPPVARVGHEAVAQRVGEPVDERDVAEDEALAEVDPVRLERIEAVRGVDHGVAAGGDDAQRLAESFAVVAHVLDHFVEHDDVEGGV